MDNSIHRLSGSATGFVNNGRKTERKPIEKESSPPQIKDHVTITRKEEAPPQEKKVKVTTFNQDPFMDQKPGVEEMEVSKIGTNLTGPRVKANDKNPKAIADVDGNFFYEAHQPQFDQVNSFVVSYKTLDLFQNLSGQNINWAFGKQLEVNSHAGQGANAYYARWQRSINFFYFDSKPLGKTVQTSQSADVVSHETGHAVLDGLKPNYISTYSEETRGFHEAFADCSAMLYNLSKDDNCEKVMEETGGDFTKNNRLSMLAEEFGAAIKRANDNPSDDNDTYLRNAINKFTYVPPEQLPESGPREELTSESHSFSRIFSGAFYEAITNLYNQALADNPPPPAQQETIDPKPFQVSALKKARDIIGPILAKAVVMSPPSSVKFKDIALNMLKADQLINQGANQSALTKAFLDKKIITPEDIRFQQPIPQMKLDPQVKDQPSALEFLSKNGEKLGINPEEFQNAQVTTDKKGNTTVEFLSTMELSLADYGIQRIKGQSDLYMDIKGGMTLSFDKEGNLVHLSQDKINQDKIIESLDFLKKLAKKELVRFSPIHRSNNLFKSRNEPYQAEIFQEASGKKKIQMIPVIM